MGKIPKSDDSPIDNWLVDLADIISPGFKKMGFTPNAITTLSLIFGLMSVMFLYNGWVYWFGITYFISLFFDCMDGFFARKYNMTSSGGDWYDHIKDAIISLLVFGVAFIRYRKTCSSITLVIVCMILLFLALINMSFVGCQGRLYKSGDSMFLYRKMCPGDAKKNISWMRYFGPGTAVLVTIVMFILLEKKLCKTE